VSREKRRGADVRASRSSACVETRARGAHDATLTRGVFSDRATSFNRERARRDLKGCEGFRACAAEKRSGAKKGGHFARPGKMP